MRRQIGRGTLWVSDEKVSFEIKIELTHPEEFIDEWEGRDYTTYQSFTSLLEMFEWIVENIDFIKRAEEIGYEISVVVHSKQVKENHHFWSFDIDSKGRAHIIVQLGDLLSKRERELESAIERIYRIISEVMG